MIKGVFGFAAAGLGQSVNAVRDRVAVAQVLTGWGSARSVGRIEAERRLRPSGQPERPSPHYSRRSRFESPVRMNRIATDGSDDAGSGYRPGVHAGARMPLGVGPATDSSAWGGPARANPEEGGARVGAIRAGRRARVRCVARHGGPASPAAGAGRCGGPSPRRERPT